jgi:DNA-binding PadR family transcriptional regulator
MINPFASTTEILVMSLLQAGEKYGLELIRESGGKLKRGTVYITLGRLEERGLVLSRIDKKAINPGLPRPRYRLTEAGERMLQAWSVVNQGERQS